MSEKGTIFRRGWQVVTVLCLMAGGGLSSCGSLQTYSFDELKPAKVNFPVEVRSVAVVNNTVSPEGARQGILTMGVVDGDGQQTAESLADVLADSKYFNQVTICDSTLRRPGDTDADIRLLTPQEIDSLSAALQADLLLSVEKVEVVTLKKSLFIPGWGAPFEAIQSKATPVLHVYLPGRETPLYRISQTDSLTWEPGLLPADQEVREETAHASALLLSRILVPYWEPATRCYFDGGGVDMRDGAVYAREGDWEQALALWKSAYEGTRSKKKQAQAAFNMALAYEMAGQVAEASEWLEKASQLAQPESALANACLIYAGQLQTRQRDLSLLNAQMQRFSENF